MFDAELESFKTAIDLRAYAASRGYVLDKRESWRGSAVMRHANGDKVIVKRDGDGHYIYFSVRDDRDHGTVIDFAAKRLGLSLGGIRKELRAWTGNDQATLPSFSPLHPVAKDRLQVYRAFAGMQDAPTHRYLEIQRGIPSSLLADERFLGRVKVDHRGNAVFPHFDSDGLVGYELKNRNFTGFSPGGIKALWLSNTYRCDVRMIVCESAIDALSHAVLFPDVATRYISLAGNPSAFQLGLVASSVALMPSGAEVVAAMDADTGGRHLAGAVRDAVAATGRSDLEFHADEPEGFKDWNDQLRAQAASSSGCSQKTSAIRPDGEAAPLGAGLVPHTK